MVYLAIALILMIIAAPIISIIPSKRQKAQMAMRQQAMKRGVSVAITRIEDPDPDPEKYLSNTGKPLERLKQVVTYRKARKRPDHWRDLPVIDWALLRTGRTLPVSVAPGWEWRGSPPSALKPQFIELLTSSLSSLPDDVVKLEESQYVVSLHWQERIEPEFLGDLLDILELIATTDPLPFSDLPKHEYDH